MDAPPTDLECRIAEALGYTVQEVQDLNWLTLRHLVRGYSRHDLADEITALCAACRAVDAEHLRRSEVVPCA